MEYPDLTEIEGRSKRYWDVDGIPEIVMGGAFVLWGAGLLSRDFIPRNSRYADVLAWLPMVVLLVSSLIANWAIKALKNKYTYPRAGYVKFLEQARSKKLLTALVSGLSGAIVAVLFVLSARVKTIADLSGPAFGVVMALGLFVVSQRPGMRHFIWYSLYSLVLGAALYPLRLEWSAISWFFIAIGLAFVLGGTWRLRAFVRSVPLPGGNES